MAGIIGSNPRLALETMVGNPIDNEQIQELTPFEANQHRGLEADYGKKVTRRHAPTPIYNCHGLTFAARRTGIFDSKTLQQIIDDDKYRKISLPAEVRAGDVIIYRNALGDFDHSGIVIEPPKADNLNVPLICSKWGKYAEVLHRANNCPYNFAGAEYYRIRL